MEKIPGLLDGFYLVSPQIPDHSLLALESDCVAEGVSELLIEVTPSSHSVFIQSAIENLSSVDYFSKRPIDFIEQSPDSLKDTDEEVRII